MVGLLFVKECLIVISAILVYLVWLFRPAVPDMPPRRPDGCRLFFVVTIKTTFYHREVHRFECLHRSLTPN